jgi:hypothetical protein
VEQVEHAVQRQAVSKLGHHPLFAAVPPRARPHPVEKPDLMVPTRSRSVGVVSVQLVASVIPVSGLIKPNTAMQRLMTP